MTGANGGDWYGTQYGQVAPVADDRAPREVGFDDAHIVTLFDGGDAAHAATAAACGGSCSRLAARMTADDVLFVVLIGHGTFDGTDAKFNLVGPDLTSHEWARCSRRCPGRVVVVNTTSASFPFLERLAGPRRIVITATDSAAQRFDTVFPEYFIRALTDPAADLDKNGRISIWEAFIAASGGVRRYYQQRGQLATERALLDDNGDGVGTRGRWRWGRRLAASRLYLRPDVPGAPPTDEELLKLLQNAPRSRPTPRNSKQRRPLMTPDEYQKEFERLMIELARVSRDIRAGRRRRSGSDQLAERSI